jgi:hypothetical protein
LDQATHEILQIAYGDEYIQLLNKLAEKDNALAEKDNALTEKDNLLVNAAVFLLKNKYHPNKVAQLTKLSTKKIIDLAFKLNIHRYL